MSSNYDWGYLDNTMNPKYNILAFNDVKHLFKKVAFDVYKQDGSDTLWELRSDKDEEYLVALYDDGETDLIVKSEDDKDWIATADMNGENITLSYKKTPIARFSSDEYQFTSDMAERFATFIEKQALSSKFVDDLVKTMPEQKRAAVLKLLQEGAV